MSNTKTKQTETENLVSEQMACRFAARWREAVLIVGENHGVDTSALNLEE